MSETQVGPIVVDENDTQKVTYANYSEFKASVRYLEHLDDFYSTYLDSISRDVRTLQKHVGKLRDQNKASEELHFNLVNFVRCFTQEQTKAFKEIQNTEVVSDETIDKLEALLKKLRIEN